MKKLIIIAAVLLIIILVGIYFFYQKTLEQTQETPKELSKEAIKVLEEIEKLNKRIAATKDVPEELKEMLEKIEDRLNYYKQEFTTNEETDAILHAYAEEQLADQLKYVEQMVRLPKTLKTIQKNVGDLNAVVRKTKLDVKPVKEIINSVEDDTIALNTLYEQKNFDEIDERIKNTGKILNEKSREFSTYIKTKRLQKDPEVVDISKKITNIKRQYAALERPIELPEEETVFEPVSAPKEQINLLFCKVQWPGEKTVETTEAVRPSMEEVKKYYLENSLGAVQLNIQYAEGNWQGEKPTERITERHAAVEVCDPSVDFQNIDGIIIYPSMQSPSWGMSKQDITTDEGNFEVGVAWISGLSATTISHELGHSIFKLPHANGLECGSQSVSNDCTLQGYGNPFDIMGGSFYSGHFNGWHKYLVGWSGLTNVTASGTYNLDALETPSASSKVLRVPYGEEGLCIEYRKPIGYDKFEKATRSIGDSMHMQQSGCLFLNVCKGKGGTKLIDTTPNSQSSTTADFADSCVKLGSTFSNDMLKISLSFTPSGDSASVNINIQPGGSMPAAKPAGKEKRKSTTIRKK